MTCDDISCSSLFASARNSLPQIRAIKAHNRHSFSKSIKPVTPSSFPLFLLFQSRRQAAEFAHRSPSTPRPSSPVLRRNSRSPPPPCAPPVSLWSSAPSEPPFVRSLSQVRPREAHRSKRIRGGAAPSFPDAGGDSSATVDIATSRRVPWCPRRAQVCTASPFPSSPRSNATVVDISGNQRR